MKIGTTDLETNDFAALTPEYVLRAGELAGYHTTGRLIALNSLENRVFQLEREEPEQNEDRWTIAKFYRPGRWSRQQILEEHQFLSALFEEQISVAAPVPLETGSTLSNFSELRIHFAIFVRLRGRVETEMTTEMYEKMGTLLARVHLVGAKNSYTHRPSFDPVQYSGYLQKYLCSHKSLPPELLTPYLQLWETLEPLVKDELGASPNIRIHGDFHLGNILWNQQEPLLVDFDDSFLGPAIYDLWPVTNGEIESLKLVVDAYRTIRTLPQISLKQIEIFRLLRVISYQAWILQRELDPTFQLTYPTVFEPKGWREHYQDVVEGIERVREAWGSL